MPQEYIEIRGVRENNSKNVSLRIPRRKITIFAGVSGSGQSSSLARQRRCEVHGRADPLPQTRGQVHSRPGGRGRLRGERLPAPA